MVNYLLIGFIIVSIIVIALLLWVSAIRYSKISLPKNKFFKKLLVKLFYLTDYVPIINFRDFFMRLVMLIVIFILVFLFFFLFFLIIGGVK